MVHLGFIRHFRGEPSERHGVNVGGTRLLIDHCVKYGVERLVVLSSGYTQREAVDRFAGLGWAAFIQKPYRMVELIEQLYNLLNR